MLKKLKYHWTIGELVTIGVFAAAAKVITMVVITRIPKLDYIATLVIAIHKALIIIPSMAMINKA